MLLLCILDFPIVGSFFICFLDGLRGGQKDDEEVLWTQATMFHLKTECLM